MFRFNLGGDYMIMTVGTDGIFHPVWPDARDGVFKLMTARIQVVPDTQRAREVQQPPPNLKFGSVNKNLSLLFELPRYSLQDKEYHVRVRFKNTSNQKIFGPLTVAYEAAVYSLRSVNGEKMDSGGLGQFTIRQLSGDLPYLEPGAVSETVELVFEHEHQRNIVPGFSLDLSGFVKPVVSSRSSRLPRNTATSTNGRN